MENSFVRRARRVDFYARGAVRDLVPYPIYRARLRRVYRRIADAGLSAAQIERINYYNKAGAHALPARAIPARDIPVRSGSYYYYDLKEYLNYFPRDVRINYQFGDIVDLMPEPRIVKSRPVVAGNGNSIVMKLDKFRHFRWPSDPLSFRDKKRTAVWRGQPFNPMRLALIKAFAGNTRHDIGHVGPVVEGVAPKPPLSIAAQLAYRYVVSIEGNDVATNLKWVMASHSLCLMPKPKFEAWFMEGRLQPGVHYVAVRDDFSDLEEKIAYYERNEDEALAIIANANAHIRQFEDGESEDVISLMVLQKYFESTDQVAAEPFAKSLFGL